MRPSIGRPATGRHGRRMAVASTAAVAAVALAACGGGSGSTSGASSGTISYWLWEAAQQPGYQKCADAFHQQNPNLTVKISQIGWADYWNKLTASFIANTAPDVFTDHISKFPQFVDLKVLRPLDQLGPTKDVKDSDYQPGLAQLWKGKDGHRYGTPKDWDTIAAFYDVKAVKAAGITAHQLDTMTWNPTNGGTFEKIVAHLTVDRNGKRGDQPGFDRNHVAVHGLGSDGGGGGGWGQTQWSAFTGSAGWQVTNKNPWGTHFNLDQKNFQDTLAWYFGLVRKGYMPSYAEIGGSNAISPVQQIQAGKAVMALNGSWTISAFAAMTDAKGKKFDIGIAPTPIGPSGHRASMFNGLADSITTISTKPEADAKWVKFLSGEQCQDIIAKAGAVFPARPKGTNLAIQYNKDVRHLDVTAFTDQVKQKTTFLFPVTSNAADITALMQPVLDSIYIGQQPVSALTGLNNQLNQLFTFLS